MIAFWMYRKYREKARNLATFPAILTERHTIFHQIKNIWKNHRTGLTFDPNDISKAPAQYFQSCTITRAYQDRADRKATYDVGKVYKLVTGKEHYGVLLVFIRTSHDFHYTKEYFCCVVMPVRPRAKDHLEGATDRVLTDVRLFDPDPAHTVVIELSLLEDMESPLFFVKYTTAEAASSVNDSAHPYALVPWFCGKRV